MKKKIALMLAAAGTAATMLPLFAAFEAHVINVTATIENALSVPVTPIAFGTVFPQEQLDRRLPIQLSGSFMTAEDADDVNYIIRQKPKCGVTTNNGTVLVGPTWTGHVVPFQNDDDGSWTYRIDCEVDKPKGLVLGTNPVQTAGLLPMLCPYLSKHELTPDLNAVGLDNDDGLAAFHHPFTIDQGNGQVIWNDVKGRLAKSEHDVVDEWNIDLKVPCFGGYCAQDWAKFVTTINSTANPDEYVQDKDNEHKVFGCNLWVEVTGVSRVNGPDSGTSRP